MSQASPDALAERIDAERIDALLPQTQCGRCGYAGCLPYATALARDEVAINRCPPGGAPLIGALARLLGRTELPLDPTCGLSPTGAPYAPPDTVARIDPAACIGCARCLPVCPVDAILGAARFLHTVITAECTGCALCLPVCPVDCIVMGPRAPGEGVPAAHQNRQRYARHLARQALARAEQAGLLAERKQAARPPRSE
jgi:electron transport complex protein RnfB